MLIPCYIICGTQHRTMLQTLKWSEDGELSELDMTRILESLEQHHPNQNNMTEMGRSNPRWKTGSPMQD